MMSVAELYFTTYNKNPKQCVCSNWQVLSFWIKGFHHPFCRMVRENDKTDGLTPKEAFEIFGGPGENNT